MNKRAEHTIPSLGGTPVTQFIGVRSYKRSLILCKFTLFGPLEEPQTDHPPRNSNQLARYIYTIYYTRPVIGFDPRTFTQWPRNGILEITFKQTAISKQNKLEKRRVLTSYLSWFAFLLIFFVSWLYFYFFGYIFLVTFFFAKKI